MKCVAIIPARMGSSRFPGKPLAEICGIPMIGHIHYRCKMTPGLDESYVATCDQEIYDYVISIGGKAIMTSDKHERASDRSAEAVAKIEAETGEKIDVIAMIQGDEPFVTPTMIELALKEFRDGETAPIVNLMAPINSEEDFESRNVVKVVVDPRNYALYFSREAIPSRKMGARGISPLKQTGLIFFRSDYLQHFNNLTPTPLEIIESVDLMRVLENRDLVKMVLTKERLVGVDTPTDLENSNRLMEGDPIFARYRNMKA